MNNYLTPLTLLALALWLTTTACGPGRKVQRYDYLTEDADEYLDPDDREATTPSRPDPRREEPRPPRKGEVSDDVALIVETALAYEGTPYRYGGMDQRGMDCSGLVCTAFAAADRRVPRTTSLMATEGTPVPLRRIEPGHIVLFAAKGGRRIDHAGLVVAVEGDEVSFIHATTSAGVRIDRLSNPYWNPRFKKAVAF